MYLRYISLTISDSCNFGSKYNYDFKCHCRYICNFLSKEVRKYKVLTDGTYNMIAIEAGYLYLPKIVYDKCMEVSVPFDKEKYEIVRGTNDASYYLELIKIGLERAFEYKKLPQNIITDLLNAFSVVHEKNEWIHKRVIFKEVGIKAILICRFTTNDFQVIVQFSSLKTKELLCEGVVIRAIPDELAFDFCFSDLLVIDNRIWITDFLKEPYIYFEIEDILSHNFILGFSNQYINDDGYYSLLMKNISYKPDSVF